MHVVFNTVEGGSREIVETISACSVVSLHMALYAKTIRKKITKSAAEHPLQNPSLTVCFTYSPL
jgi:hypothetical protein